MKLLLEIPLNNLSFGNVSYNLVRELYKREAEIGIFPIGEKVNLNAFDVPEELVKYIQTAIDRRWEFLHSEIPSLKLWHLNGSENRKNPNQTLLTFYECNDPTEVEFKICEVQNNTIFSSTHAQDQFKFRGARNTHYVPMGFDEDFFETKKTYLHDTVHFGLMGKFEKRKHTQKIIQTWLKKYGNDSKYQLSCCVNNPFFKPEQMKALIDSTLEGRNYNNINFIPHLEKNKEVNEFLNSINIDLTGLSGGEGWNLPAFNSTCLGKWSVVLKCTSHKDWANEDNSIQVTPSGQMPAADGVFFNKGGNFNQGSFKTWDEEEAISAMEKAESKAGQINTEGQKLADKFTYSNTLQQILDCINSPK